MAIPDGTQRLLFRLGPDSNNVEIRFVLLLYVHVNPVAGLIVQKFNGFLAMPKS